MSWVILAPIAAAVSAARTLLEQWRSYREGTSDVRDVFGALATAGLLASLGIGALASPFLAGILVVGFVPIELGEAWKALRRKRRLKDAQDTGSTLIG